MGEIVRVNEDDVEVPVDNYPQMLLYDVERDTLRKFPVLANVSGHSLCYMCSSFLDNGRAYFFVQISRYPDRASHVGSYLLNLLSGTWTREESLTLPDGLFGGVKVMPQLEQRPLHIGGYSHSAEGFAERNLKVRGLRMSGDRNETWVVNTEMSITEAEAGVGAADWHRDFLSAIWVPVESMSCTLRESK